MLQQDMTGYQPLHRHEHFRVSRHCALLYGRGVQTVDRDLPNDRRHILVSYQNLFAASIWSTALINMNYTTASL